MAIPTQDDPRRFLHPDAVHRISGLELRARQVVEGFISGMHRSPFFGHSIEFRQHRDYTSGDDIRHLDWKVWSKTDKFYIKQYEAETNLRSHFILDVSASMAYGNGAMNKYEYACTAAACLGYLILRQQDSAGIMTFDEDIRNVVPARSQTTHLEAILKAMHVSRPREKTDIEKILRRVAENAPSRGLIVIISDLLVEREPFFRGLEMLRHGRHDIIVFHVMDHEELTFPFTGMTRFEGMELMEEVLCEPRQLRDGYLEALEEYLVEVRRGCVKRGVDYQLIHTKEYLDAVLSKYLHYRDAVARSHGKK